MHAANGCKWDGEHYELLIPHCPIAQLADVQLTYADMLRCPLRFDPRGGYIEAEGTTRVFSTNYPENKGIYLYSHCLLQFMIC